MRGRLMELSFDDFLNELKKEVQYHQAGSTSFRRKVAVLAFVAATEIGHLEDFKNRDTAVKAVANLFPTLEDKELVNDIAKMLHVVYRSMNFKLNMPNDMKQYLEQKRINRKPLGFKNIE